ncbi:YSIRK-targeted triacylglycerol lipase [Staphylococcus simulans]|uniref:YSIRK-targeted triacylglycerol lipase n=1 Tax=Staphylococcus simulans TaxID=1286 RepID=UPI003F8098EE
MKQHPYRISKLTIGTSSMIAASLFFADHHAAHASGSAPVSSDSSAAQATTQSIAQPDSSGESTEQTSRSEAVQPSQGVVHTQIENNNQPQNTSSINSGQTNKEQPQTTQAPTTDTSQSETTPSKETEPSPAQSPEPTQNEEQAQVAPQTETEHPVQNTKETEADTEEVVQTQAPTESQQTAKVPENNTTTQTPKSTTSSVTPETAPTAQQQPEPKSTTNTQSQQQVKAPDQTATTQNSGQVQYKNQDPIILVHGFNGLVGDNAAPSSGNYWGGNRTDIQQDLRDNGYNVHEANVGAYSSNYDRAVELYYYIKGGRVDYGAAHSQKYGHERYGKTYEGVYPQWQPGQKVHLVGHSMGGQTIRQMEEFLRNGNQEEIDYHQQHGGTISPLFEGGKGNMVSSIYTVASPHNGTHAADLLGNEALIRQILYDNAKLQGNKYSQVDYGLSQWGMKQGENESYTDYVDRVRAKSKIWTTTDNALYDLTREGAQKLNENTTLNPNIVYKSYSGESTRPGILDRQRSDIHMATSKVLTGNVIGKVDDKEWRENDGLVSVISAQHPFNQNATPMTEQPQKGVWQVNALQHDWDHGDFVGSDALESQITPETLRAYWLDIADELVQNEAVTR